jgi:ubiquinone/menaquinone biosynthesis C-methylase UbiE
VSFARILEPELMDTEDEALEYHAMDFSEPDGRFAKDALALVRGVASPEMIDFGTGTAKIPVLICQARKDARVYAVDPAAEMLRVAAQHVAAARLDHLITLARSDGRTTKLAAARFDAVLSNSTVHHIHQPLALFREMKRVLKPGGAILVRDLCRPKSMDDAWAIVKRVAAGDSLRQQQLFFDSLCAALTVEEVEKLLAEAGWGELKVTMSSDRHWSVERAAKASG